MLNKHLSGCIKWFFFDETGGKRRVSGKARRLIGVLLAKTRSIGCLTRVSGPRAEISTLHEKFWINNAPESFEIKFGRKTFARINLKVCLMQFRLQSRCVAPGSFVHSCQFGYLIRFNRIPWKPIILCYSAFDVWEKRGSCYGFTFELTFCIHQQEEKLVIFVFIGCPSISVLNCRIVPF